VTKINCHITERIQKDFDSLWRCKQRGNTVEITTPYLLPDSTLLSLFITKRSEKFIVHDGGSISQIVAESCPFPDDEIKSSLAGFSVKYGIMRGRDAANQTIYFKDCKKPSLISSIAFDLASFATTVTNVLVAASIDEPGIEPDERFQRNADSFIKSVIPTGLKFKPRCQIQEVPGVKFSAVIQNSNRIWIVSYVTGSTLPYFLRSIAITKMNFEHVWDCKLAKHNAIGGTIPLLNTDARGYQPRKIEWQTKMLKVSARETLLTWSGRGNFVDLLN